MQGIQGEYWISNGSVNFADGDIGDYNHESIASQAVFSQFTSEIIALANDFDIDTEDVDDYGEINQEGISNILRELEEHLSAQEVMQKIGANKEAYLILYGQGNPQLFVMKYDGWIAVRSNNVELYGYDEAKRRSLLNGLEEILYQEGGENDDEESEEELEFSVHDFKSNRSYYLSLNDLKNPVAPRPQSPILTKGDRRFTVYSNPESIEKNKSVQNKWNAAAQQAKIIPPGHELWRGTSEGMSFRGWMLNELTRAIVKDLSQWLNDNEDELPFSEIFPENETRMAIPFGEPDPIANSILEKIEKAGLTIDFEKGVVQKDGRETRLGKFILGKYSPMDLNEKTWWSHQGNAVRSLHNAMYANNFAIVISRNPIDIARMSDHDGWTSCHAPHREYFQCTLAEARGGGGIAYIVDKNELNNVDLQAPEIFYDKSRPTGKGIEPISRVRLRRFVHKKENYDLAVPEDRVYGEETPGFTESLRKWTLNKQQNILNGKRPKLQEFKLMGGGYQDTNAAQLFNKFFNDNIDTGSVEYGGDDEYGGMLNQYEEEVKAIEKRYENIWDLCGYYASVEEDGGQVYVSMGGVIAFEIPENQCTGQTDSKWGTPQYRAEKTQIEEWAKSLRIYNVEDVELEAGFGPLECKIRINSDGMTPDDLDTLLNELKDYEKDKDKLRASFYELMIEMGYAKPNTYHNSKNHWTAEQFQNFVWDSNDDENALEIVAKNPIDCGPEKLYRNPEEYHYRDSFNDPQKTQLLQQELMKQLNSFATLAAKTRQLSLFADNPVQNHNYSNFQVVPEIRLEFEHGHLGLRVGIYLRPHHTEEATQDGINFLHFLDRYYFRFSQIAQALVQRIFRAQ